MQLSETDRGADWLTNFNGPEDQELARDLLDSLSIVTWSDARAALSDLLDAALIGWEAPHWMVPVMAREDILRHLSLARGTQITLFENYFPGSGIASLSGSEGAVGNLVREFVKRANVVNLASDLSALRRKKIRTVVLVTDFIGTGSQVLDFIETMLTSPSLKSWSSYGWVRFVVVAYAASAEAQQKLRGHSRISDLRIVRTEPTISTLPWTASKKASAISLCRRYPPGRGGLGFKDHGGLFAIQESVPNTIPKIFTHEAPGWMSLFGSRLMPSDIREQVAGTHIPTVEFDQLALQLNQKRLAQAISRQMRSANKQVLTVISLCTLRTGSLARVESALGVTTAEAERLVRYCVKSGWIDENYSATIAGGSELAAGKRKIRRVESISLGDRDTYYPESLR